MYNTQKIQNILTAIENFHSEDPRTIKKFFDGVKLGIKNARVPKIESVEIKKNTARELYQRGTRLINAISDMVWRMPKGPVSTVAIASAYRYIMENITEMTAALMQATEQLKIEVGGAVAQSRDIFNQPVMIEPVADKLMAFLKQVADQNVRSDSAYYAEHQYKGDPAGIDIVSPPSEL